MSKRIFTADVLEQEIAYTARNWALQDAPPSLQGAILRQIRAQARPVVRFTLPLGEVLALGLMVLCFSILVSCLALLSLPLVREGLLLGWMQMQIWVWRAGISFQWLAYLLMAVAIMFGFGLVSLGWQTLEKLFARPMYRVG
jgi:uncharacterized membrane protein